MEWRAITKSPATGSMQPNLVDYDATCAQFSWDHVRRELSGLPDGRGLNIAHEAIDRHASGPRRQHLALRCLGRDGTVNDFTYEDLQEQTSRFANVLGTLGVGTGDRVFVLAGRIPELYIAALGTLKNTSVFCPLFSAFGPEPIYQRLSRGDARVLVTTERLYKQKVAGLHERLPQLQHVLLTEVEADVSPGVWSLPQRMAAAASTFTIPATDPEDMAVLISPVAPPGCPKAPFTCITPS